MIVEWVIWIVTLMFSFLLLGGVIETALRNRGARFPNYFTPILLSLLFVGSIYFQIKYFP